MDVCKCRSNLYDLSNRNKTSLMRPVASGSTANLTANFTKIGPVRSQVKHFCIKNSVNGVSLIIFITEKCVSDKRQSALLYSHSFLSVHLKQQQQKHLPTPQSNPSQT